LEERSDVLAKPPETLSVPGDRPSPDLAQRPVRDARGHVAEVDGETPVDEDQHEARDRDPKDRHAYERHRCERRRALTRERQEEDGQDREAQVEELVPEACQRHRAGYVTRRKVPPAEQSLP